MKFLYFGLIGLLLLGCVPVPTPVTATPTFTETQPPPPPPTETPTPIQAYQKHFCKARKVDAEKIESNKRNGNGDYGYLQVESRKQVENFTETEDGECAF